MSAAAFRIVGVDPGIHGALALLDGEGRLLAVEDMPVMARSQKKNEVNAAAVAALLREWCPDRVVLERVGAMPMVGKRDACQVCKRTPSQGTASSFNFGDSFGRLIGILAALEIPYTLVMPAVWKRGAGLLGQDKEMSRAAAIRLYPGAPLTRKKDVGRAEAILIARHGLNGMTRTTNA